MKQFIKTDHIINIEALEPEEDADFPDGIINIYTDDGEFVAAHYSDELIQTIETVINNKSQWLTFEDFNEDEEAEDDSEVMNWAFELSQLIKEGMSSEEALELIQ
jgi:hypothetical protein